MEMSGRLHAPGTLPRAEGALGTHCLGGRVGPRACLDAVVKRKITSPYGDSNPRSSTAMSYNNIPMIFRPGIGSKIT